MKKCFVIFMVAAIVLQLMTAAFAVDNFQIEKISDSLLQQMSKSGDEEFDVVIWFNEPELISKCRLEYKYTIKKCETEGATIETVRELKEKYLELVKTTYKSENEKSVASLHLLYASSVTTNNSEIMDLIQVPYEGICKIRIVQTTAANDYVFCGIAWHYSDYTE